MHPCRLCKRLIKYNQIYLNRELGVGWAGEGAIGGLGFAHRLKFHIFGENPVAWSF